MTGLDYYHARYYDPAVGLFLTPDSKQGNMQGVNPYAYVQGNPETLSDPSGQYVVGTGGQKYYPEPAPPNNPPSQPKHNLGYLAARQQQTYNLAKTARDWFNGIADNLNLSNSLPRTLLGLILSAIGTQFNAWGSGISMGLLAALATVGNMATELANAFKQETDQVDLWNGQGLKYFNLFNVASAGNQMLTHLMSEAAKYMLGEFAAGMAAFWLAVLLPDPEPLSKGTILQVGTALGTGAWSAEAFTAVGVLILYKQASDYVDQEEKVAPDINACTI